MLPVKVLPLVLKIIPEALLTILGSIIYVQQISLRQKMLRICNCLDGKFCNLLTICVLIMSVELIVGYSQAVGGQEIKRQQAPIRSEGLQLLGDFL
jgi:hypothetical protein